MLSSWGVGRAENRGTHRGDLQEAMWKTVFLIQGWRGVAMVKKKGIKLDSTKTVIVKEHGEGTNKVIN